MKKFRQCFLGIGLCAAVLPVMVSSAYEDKGFASREESLEFFVQEIRECDFEGALQAFPIKTSSENFDFEGYLDRYKSWIPDSTINYPPTSELYKSINQNEYASKAMKYIYNFAVYLTSDPAFLEGKALLTEETDIVGLMEAASSKSENIGNLKIERMDYFDPEMQDGEVMQNSFKRQSDLYGGDGLSTYLVLYRLDDEFYVGGATFIQYGDEYYLWDLNCLGGMAFEGMVIPVTEEEYLSFMEP